VWQFYVYSTVTNFHVISYSPVTNFHLIFEFASHKIFTEFCIRSSQLFTLFYVHVISYPLQIVTSHKNKDPCPFLSRVMQRLNLFTNNTHTPWYFSRNTKGVWRSSQWHQFPTISETEFFRCTRHLDQHRSQSLFIACDSSLAASFYLQQRMPSECLKC
jgi:hypothetical protein